MRTLILLWVLVSLLSGCSPSSSHKPSDAKLQEAKATVDRHVANPIPVSRSDQIWVSSKPREIKEDLPKIFSTNAVMVVAEPVDLNDVAGMLSRISSIPVTVHRASDVSGVPSPTAAPGPIAPTESVRRPLAHNKGSFKQLINYIAATFDVAWSYENNRIVFRETVTESIRLALLPITQDDITLKVSNAAQAENNSDSDTPTVHSSHETRVTISQKFWASIASSTRQMLSNFGSLSISPETGFLTVTDRPSRVEQIRTHIELTNRQLSRSAVFQVRVLAVQSSLEDNLGFNWDVIWQTLGRNAQLSITTPRGTANGLANMTASVLSSSSSSFAGSSAFIDALSTQGSVSEITNTTVVAMHNQGSPLLVGRNTPYLKRVTSSSVDTTTSSGLEPGNQTTGFSMVLLASIISDTRLILQLALSRSNLLELRTVSSAGQSIELPLVDVTDSIQRVPLSTGQTLMLTGYDQFNDSREDSGLFSPENWWAGGRKNQSQARTTLVILVTPTVIQQ